MATEPTREGVAATSLIPFMEATDAQKIRHVLMSAMVLTGTCYTHGEWDEAMAALDRLEAADGHGTTLPGATP